MRERERKREERGREKDREVKPNKLPVAIVFLLVRSFGLTWGHSSSLFLTHTHTRSSTTHTDASHHLLLLCPCSISHPTVTEETFEDVTLFSMLTCGRAITLAPFDLRHCALVVLRNCGQTPQRGMAAHPPD